MSSRSEYNLIKKLRKLIFLFLMLYVTQRVYADILWCSHPDCTSWRGTCDPAFPTSCNCVSDCHRDSTGDCTSYKWGSNECDESCCKSEPKNIKPTCSINSGPQDIMTGEINFSVYFSSVNDEDSDNNTLSCSWDDNPDRGWFPRSTCSDALYTVRSGSGDETLTMTVRDNKNDTGTCTYDVDVYDCTTINFSGGNNRAVIGGLYNLFANVAGPASPPTFTFSSISQLVGGGLCGSIINNDKQAFSWQLPYDPDLRGKQCYVRSTAIIGMPMYGGSWDQCDDRVVQINSLPDCNDVAFSIVGAAVTPGVPPLVDTCGAPVTISASNVIDSEGDTITYEWSVNCETASTGNGAFNGPTGAIGSSTLWDPPIPVSFPLPLSWQDNDELCTFNVKINDGYEETQCNNIGAARVHYIYNLQFQVDETVRGNCANVLGPADGVTVTLQNYGSLTDGDAPDLLDSVVTFDGIYSTDHTFATNFYYVPECAAYRLNCTPDAGPSIDGNTATISVEPGACRDIPIEIDMFEEALNPWESAIDADIFSQSQTTDIHCAGDDLGDGFYGSLIQFSDVSDMSPIKDAFVHNFGDNNVESAVCPELMPTGGVCGYAKNTEHYSSWYNDIFNFRPPEHMFVRTITSFDEVTAASVHVMDASDFNNAFSLGDVNYRIDGRDSILYVISAAGDTLNIQNSMNETAGQGRLLIITAADVTIDESIGYNSFGPPGGYRPQASPNIEAGIITSGTIYVYGGVAPVDLPLLLTGPLVADNIIFERNIGLDNDMYPATSVKYYPKYLPRFTEMERSRPYCAINFTGISKFDVQFDYGVSF